MRRRRRGLSGWRRGREALDEEGIVLDDGGDGVGAVLVAHVLVLHGEGVAAGATLLREVHALVRFGWLAREVVVGCCHGTPPVYTGDLLMRLKLWIGIYQRPVVSGQW